MFLTEGEQNWPDKRHVYMYPYPDNWHDEVDSAFSCVDADGLITSNAFLFESV